MKYFSRSLECGYSLKATISAIVVFMLVLVAITYSASAATVSIENVTLGEGENTVVPIWINNTVDAAKGATINLTYNASMVHVIDFGNSGFNFEVYNETNNITGYFLYGVATFGLTGDIKFVEVTLKAVGNAEDQSLLNLTVLSLNNGTGKDSIPRDVINGTFTILGGPNPTPSPSPSPSPCFIATAAYGTPLHEDIDALRDFRDEYLMTNPIGRTFVEIYYTTSPPIADVIRENEGLRTCVREGLIKPLVYISRVFVG